MNKQDLSYKKNDVARLVRHSNRSGSHRNCIKINPHDSIEHELAKFKLCRELIKEGKTILVEARFEGYKGRCDILVLDTGTVYEILKSETLENLKKKVAKYPPELEIIGVYANTGKEVRIR